MTTAAPTTADLVAQYQRSPDPRLRASLVRQHLRLVRQIALSYRDRHSELVEDLVQVGCIGLLHAIDRFNPDFGKGFEAYAGSLISGEIKHYLRDHAPLVRPPRELVELRASVYSTTAKLSQHGQPPTAGEVAETLGIPVKKVEEVLELDANSHPVSLDDGGEEDEGKPSYQLVDGKYRSFQLAQEDRIMLAQAMGRLRSVSREVIEFAFYQDLTQTQIANKLGISQMQVSRRLKTATSELWKILNQRLW